MRRVPTSMRTRSPSRSLRDRAAARGFGRDVADHEAVGGAAETAVGDQRDVVAQALADQRGGDRQHLAHAGAAGRAFEADHHDVAGDDPARLHRGERGFLGIEHARRAFEMLAAVAGELDDAAFRREVAVEDRIAAARLDRRRATGRTTSCWPRARATSSSSAKNERPVTVAMSSIRPAARSSRADQRGAALLEHFRGGVAAAGLEVGDHRRARAMRLRTPRGRTARRPRARSPAGAAPHWSSRPWPRPRARRCAARLERGCRAVPARRCASGPSPARRRPARRQACRHGSPGCRWSRSGDRPRKVSTIAMVLAVNWPPQAPAPGQACDSMRVQLGVVDAAGGVRADGFEDVLDGQRLHHRVRPASPGSGPA